jgi:hypothetical protein
MNQEAENEEFEIWLKTKFVDYVWISGHKFRRTKTSDIDVDEAPFTEAEAKILYSMLSSNNPLKQLNGSLIIWGRNGILIKFFLVVVILMLLIAFVILRR